MGAGSSASKTRVLAKVHTVAALSTKSKEKKDQENLASDQELQKADDFVTKASIRKNQHRVQYNDTSKAWKVLNHGISRSIKGVQVKDQLPKQISTESAKFECENKKDGPVDPMHVYGARRKISREENCNFCETAGNYNGTCHGCRVCDKLYHHSCLQKKGYLRDELSAKALSLSDSEVGWSCPSCESILDLLDESEKAQVIEAFDKMVGNETSVNLEKYMLHKKESYNNLIGIDMSFQRENQEVRLFKELDRDGSGTLEWWEFAPSMSVRILGKRSQAELVALLTAREVTKLESFFKMYDKQGQGKLKLSDAKSAYLRWFLSLIKKEEDKYVPMSWTGDLPAGWHGKPKDIVSCNQTEAQVTWQEFLLMNALHVISARPNTVETRPYAPTVDEAIRIENGDGEIGLKMKTIVSKANVDEVSEITDPVARIKMRLKNTGSAF